MKFIVYNSFEDQKERRNPQVLKIDTMEELEAIYKGKYEEYYVVVDFDKMEIYICNYVNNLKAD